MTRTFVLLSLCAVALFVAIALVANGCRSGSPTTVKGFLIGSYEDLQPDRLTLEKSSLELAGWDVPVEIKQKHQGNEFQIELWANGVVYETERYESTKEAFSFIGTVGERFEPSISLVKYPMHVGDQWEWKGVVWTGPAPHNATAKITTGSENMVVNGGTIPNALRVEVDLSTDSGIPEAPASRKLKFWIAREKGVVKREFGDYSARKPLEE